MLSTNSVSRSTSIARNSTSISLSSAANGQLHTELPETESPYQHQYSASKRPRLSSNENNTRSEAKSSAIDTSIEAPAAGRSSAHSVAVTISVEVQVQEKSHLHPVGQTNDNVKVLKAKSDEHLNVETLASTEQNRTFSTKHKPPLSGLPSTKAPGIVNAAPASPTHSPCPNDQSNPASSTIDYTTVPKLFSY